VNVRALTPTKTIADQPEPRKSQMCGSCAVALQEDASSDEKAQVILGLRWLRLAARTADPTPFPTGLSCLSALLGKGDMPTDIRVLYSTYHDAAPCVSGQLMHAESCFAGHCRLRDCRLRILLAYSD
jgi:hypothetical protein